MVLFLGKLDGVHAGHRHLAARAMEEADRRGALAAAVVLHPDPRTVLLGTPVPLLCSVEERLARLRVFGVDLVEPMLFTPGMAMLDPDGFLDLLGERYRLEAIVCGPDFRFGRGRMGDARGLDRAAETHGFDCVVVPPIESRGSRVASRGLRRMIEAGDVEGARALMRHPCRLVATVVHGAARGRSLGYPTANLDPAADYVLPKDGIYAVRACWRDRIDDRLRTAGGVASIGVRPTFDHGERRVEVHLFDLDLDLYGLDLTVDFLARLRDERRFPCPEALIEQMRSDVEQARRELLVEDAVAAGARNDGERWSAHGRDVGQVAQALSSALLEPRDSGSCDARERVCLAVEGRDAAPTVQAWLQLLSDRRAAGLCPVRVDVYYASASRILALVVQRRGSADARRGSVRLDRLERVAGLWEGRMRVIRP